MSDSDCVSFADFGLHPELLEAIEDCGYKQPTPIQAQAIPVAMAGKDVLGGAQTGTGKTAAFLLPILHGLEHTEHPEHERRLALRARTRRDGIVAHIPPPPGPRVLVLSPTRELAMQIEAACSEYARHTDLISGLVYGGVSTRAQESFLRAGVDILIATPGRLMDHLSQRTVDLSAVRYLVLDECDRMLDMGFIPDVEHILSFLTTERQTMLFSATLTKEVRRIAKSFTRNPVIVEVAPEQVTAATVEQHLYPVAQWQKADLLLELVPHLNVESMLIFTRTKRNSGDVAARISAAGHCVGRLNSDYSQSMRETTLRGFREGKFHILVATDVAARGLDIDRISHVVNFDVPEYPEDYVHRIGRTGRANETGMAITLMAPAERELVDAIEKLSGEKLLEMELPDFPYDTAPASRSRSRAATSERGFDSDFPQQLKVRRRRRTERQPVQQPATPEQEAAKPKGARRESYLRRGGERPKRGQAAAKADHVQQAAPAEAPATEAPANPPAKPRGRWRPAVKN